MLIITRSAAKSLCIGRNIRITVLGFNGRQVRLGIEAPRHIPVHREEAMPACLVPTAEGAR